MNSAEIDDDAPLQAPMNRKIGFLAWRFTPNQLASAQYSRHLKNTIIFSSSSTLCGWRTHSALLLRNLTSSLSWGTTRIPSGILSAKSLNPSQFLRGRGFEAEVFLNWVCHTGLDLACRPRCWCFSFLGPVFWPWTRLRGLGLGLRGIYCISRPAYFRPSVFSWPLLGMRLFQHSSATTDILRFLRPPMQSSFLSTVPSSKGKTS